VIRVRVPSTCANLGPGFDALGLALNLYDRFEVEAADRLVVEGCEPELSGPDNLFVRAAKRAHAELGLPLRGMRVRFDADVPVARGLGSSAACIVGGLLAGAALASGRADALPRDRLLDLACELEGHPDNTTPALLGGFAVSIMDGRRVRSVRTPLGGALAFRALVPPFPLETSKARAALPATVPHADAVFNLGRAALLAAALATGNVESLGAACADRLHEPYRAHLIPGFAEVVAAARDAGAIAVFLSGAGPTVMAVTRAGDDGFVRAMEPALAAMKPTAWRLLDLSADDTGAVIEAG